MPKISELLTIADADLTLKDLIPLVDRDAAGNVIVGTKNMTVEQSRRLTALDATLASITSNTVAVTGPAWGVTTDDKVVFLPEGGVSVDAGSGVDWDNDLIDLSTGLIKTDKLPDLIIAGLRQGTKAELDAADPPLEPNEPAFETDTEVLRVGDVEVGAPFASQAETDASTVSGKAVSPSTLRLRKDGNGAFSIGDLGGNARGEDSITLQPSRSADTEVASGFETVAIGKDATAAGDTASGYYGVGGRAVAIGSGATSTGNNGSVAIGFNATSSGGGGFSTGGIAIGSGASGVTGVAIGGGASASGGGIALGGGSTATTVSVAVGSSSDASATNSVALGYSSSSSGAYGSALGVNSEAGGSSSTASGRYTKALQTNSGAFGYYVKSAVANVQELGYWSGSTARAGAVRVHGTGMVAMTYQDRATEYDASLAGNGSEADNELADGMFAIRTNGNDVILDINIGGTVKNINLGTAA